MYSVLVMRISAIFYFFTFRLDPSQVELILPLTKLDDQNVIINPRLTRCDGDRVGSRDAGSSCLSQESGRLNDVRNSRNLSRRENRLWRSSRE